MRFLSERLGLNQNPPSRASDVFLFFLYFKAKQKRPPFPKLVSGTPCAPGYFVSSAACRGLPAPPDK
jgi:hypothetical protein